MSVAHETYKKNSEVFQSMGIVEAIKNKSGKSEVHFLDPQGEIFLKA